MSTLLMEKREGKGVGKSRILRLLRRAVEAVDHQRRVAIGKNRNVVLKQVAEEQFEETVESLSGALVLFFNEQGRSMESRLKKTSVSAKETAESLAKKIFDPREWDDELTNVALPPLAVGMAEAAVAHLLTFGIDVRKKKKKATSASAWVEENEEDWDSLVEAFAAMDVPLGILAEIPPWMQQSIATRLTESFQEDYWDAINDTTLGNAETVLRRGLAEGQSINEMATQLREYFLGDDESGKGFRYARARSENIARTESGNALNAARKDSVAQLQEELGDEVPMKQEWLSVLGNTTRVNHANLDGVPENKSGMWILGGIAIPWPSHISLPPENRCNCQCTLTIAFGMRESEALRLIEESEERLSV